MIIQFQKTIMLLSFSLFIFLLAQIRKMLTSHLLKQQVQCLQFCSLQLTFRCIKVINNVPATVRFIVRLNLTGNHLMSLNGIQQFHNLQTFIFNYNHIALPTELDKINNRFFIKGLSFIANPLYYAADITKDMLRGKGFTRLYRLNQFERVHASPQRQNTRLNINGKGGKSVNQSMAETEFTTRRRPNYRHSPEESRTSRKVGKIYYNKFMTGRREVSKEGIPNNTRESTMKQSMQASVPYEPKSMSPPQEHHHGRQSRKIKPFDQSLQESAETAKFSQVSELQRLGEDFLSEEKQLLADLYHEKCILEKYFWKWKTSRRLKTIENELQPYRGQLINNTLETLHFSLIKLRHEFIQRT